MSILLARALIALRPNAEFTIRGEEYEGIDWSDSRPIPSKQDVTDQIEIIKVQELRAAKYPSLIDQFDLLYHGGYDAWRAAVQSVKDKYPKT